MKKILSLFLLTISLTSNGQGGTFGTNPIINLENFDKKTVHWGYYLGFNFYDFKFDYNEPDEDIKVKTGAAFNVGLIGNLRISEHLDLRFEPGLSYTQRDLIFPHIEDEFEKKREVKSTYINFPLLLKYSAKRTGNIKPYLIAGYSYSLNLASNYNAKDDNFNQKFRMKRTTGNIEAGLGIDIYFEYFKFSPSVRGVFGMGDEIIPDNTANSPWTGNISKMQTRGVFLNFAFH